MHKIGVVIVTFNRLEKLKIALKTYDEQTFLPSYIIVVDNSSTDGTKEYLEKWENEETKYTRDVIFLESNTGGSGGFFYGLNAALEKDADWIWVSDDDAFPEKNALLEASLYLENAEGEADSISALCGVVLNKDQIDKAHRKTMYRKGLKICTEFAPEDNYQKRSFEINCFSYVGTIIHKKKLNQAGLPNKDYFLWWDDTEHSLRLSKIGRIVCAPSIRVHHDVENGKGEFTWKTYYGFRNMVDLYKHHFPTICYKYYIYKLMCKTYVMDLFGCDREMNKAIRRAIIDSKKGKFGIHNLYKPGWKPEKLTVRVK